MYFFNRCPNLVGLLLNAENKYINNKIINKYKIKSSLPYFGKFLIID